MRSPFSPLFPRPSRPGDFGRSSYTFPSKPFPIFMALLWTLSSSFVSFLCCGAQNCTQLKDCTIKMVCLICGKPPSTQDCTNLK